MNTTGLKSPPTMTPTDNISAPNVEQPTKEKKFPVIEIFGPVIQGEGSQAGQQTMFIRFGGCDFRCTKCDSLHAVDPRAVQKHATYMTAAEIEAELQKAREATGVHWVTLSGGNPAMHKLEDLLINLGWGGWLINVETQGSLWQDWLNLCDVITVSPKSMGMGEKFEPTKFGEWVKKVERPLCVKVVVFSAQDFETALYVEDVVRENISDQRLCVFYLSLGNPYPPTLDEEFNLVEPGFPPTFEGLAKDLLRRYKSLSEEVLQDPRLKNWKFLPQLHVLVYGNEAGR